MPSNTFFNLPEEKRETFLRSARREFAQKPYSEASINQIIREAGIPRGSFYMYFSDKEDLFRYLMERHAEGLLERLIHLLEAERGDLFAALTRMVEQAGEDARLQEQRELIQVVRNNLGVHQTALLRTLWPQRLAERLIGYIDLSRLNLRREEELGELLQILFGITAPALCAAAVGGDSGAVCARYRVQLDILKRGMAAPNPPAARGDESKE